MTAISPGIFSVSEVELIYRTKINPTDRPHVNTSSAAFDVLLNAWDKNKIELVEQFGILLLNRANYCLGYSCICTGGVSHCIVDAKIVFASALKANASQIILAHNHPSGNLAPSKADIALTNKLAAAGALLDIKVTDHLIVTPSRYYSFGDEGLLI